MTGEHVAALELRRYRAGELPAGHAERVQAHATQCARCRAQLRELADEQARFEREVPFERFAAKVERARVAGSGARPAWMSPALGIAAAALVVAIVAPRLQQAVTPETGTNRTKGGAEMLLRIAGEGGAQREANVTDLESLQPGDRVRIGYHNGGHRFVSVVSIDEAGVVEPLYPVNGESLPVEESEGAHFLPDSLEFTGSGAERVVVVLTDAPIGIEAVVNAAQDAFRRSGGDVRRMPPLPLTVPGEQFHRTLLKP
jgi:hypothetical protein